MNKIIACYRIYNQHGWCYIGATSNLKKRISKHFSTLNRGLHHNSKFQWAYDLDRSFDWKVVYIEYDNIEDALAFEIISIKGLQPTGKLFNISDGGNNSNTIAFMSEEEKADRIKRIVSSRTTYKHSEATKLKLSDASKAQSKTSRILGGQKQREQSPEKKLRLAIIRAETSKARRVSYEGKLFRCLAEANYYIALDKEVIHDRCRREVKGFKYLDFIGIYIFSNSIPIS